MHLNNRIMAMLPSELDRLCAKAQAAPDFSNLQASFEAQKKSVAAAYGESEKPKLKNGSIGDNGVAVINVKGALFNVESYWDEILAFYFGGSSYQSLMRDIDLVTNDSSVKAVGFFVHSPGGEAFGMNETSNKIAALTAAKPTIGYAYGFAASAGFGLIAATGEIYADANAWVGSIGTVMGWADYSGMYEKFGIAYEEVTSSNAPYKRLDIRIPEEREVFMSEIDGVEEVFIKSVAKNRKISIEKVKSDFGKGAVMAGKAARSAGMIDVIGSWDEVLRKLQTKAKKAGNTSANNSAKTGEQTMNLRDRIMAIFADEEDTAPTAEGDNETAGATAPKSEAKSPALIAAEEEVARLRAEQKEGKVTAVATKAESLAAAEITTGRMLPTEKDNFVASYIQAATDDEKLPLSEGSRVARIEAQQTSRKSNHLTTETINAKTNQIVLGAQNDEDVKMNADVETQADEYVKTTGGTSKK